MIKLFLHYSHKSNLQIDSRRESALADQNIKLLTSGLPESMAKLSHLGSTVDDLSENLRNLTNSGYKFKSGNVSEQISELSTLKFKRDRLRESAEILQNGIRIEEDGTNLQGKKKSKTDKLPEVCSKYVQVSNALKSLSSISRFRDLNSKLKICRFNIEKRLKEIMTTACSSEKASVFIENAQLSKQIEKPDLPLTVVTDYLQSKIKTIRNSYDL